MVVGLVSICSGGHAPGRVATKAPGQNDGRAVKQLYGVHSISPQCMRGTGSAHWYAPAASAATFAGPRPPCIHAFQSMLLQGIHRSHAGFNVVQISRGCGGCGNHDCGICATKLVQR